VESTERPSPRLEEGLATYLEWRAFDVLEGEDRYEPVLAWLTDATRETLANDSQAVVIAPADYGRAGRQDLSYSVGMIFFAILEKLVGEAELHRLLAGFYQEHGDRGASVRELADHLTRESRVPVGPFVEAALFETELVRAVAAGKSGEEIAASYAAR
jgi:aminopeptidase N